MTKEEFLLDVQAKVSDTPREWRLGQAIFNVVDAFYGVARDVQFIDKIDCFYDDGFDGSIDQFLEAAWNRVKEKGNE